MSSEISRAAALTARGGLNAGLPYLEGLFVSSAVTLLVLPLNNHLMVLLSLSAPPQL